MPIGVLPSALKMLSWPCPGRHFVLVDSPGGPGGEAGLLPPRPMGTSPACSSEPSPSPSALAHHTPGTRIFSGVWPQACLCLRPFARAAPSAQKALHADVPSASSLPFGWQLRSQPPRTIPIWSSFPCPRCSIHLRAILFSSPHRSLSEASGPVPGMGPFQGSEPDSVFFSLNGTPCLANPTV